MYKIIPREEFEYELDKIEEYISEEFCNPDAARGIVDGILESVGDLEIFPKMHPVCETRESERKAREYRRLVKGNYSVLYYIDEDEDVVYLAHVYNHRQMFDFRLTRDSTRFVNESGIAYSIIQERERISMIENICPKSIKESWNINLTAKTIEHVVNHSGKFESRIYRVGDVIQTKHVKLDVAEAFGVQVQ